MGLVELLMSVAGGFVLAAVQGKIIKWQEKELARRRLAAAKEITRRINTRRRLTANWVDVKTDDVLLDLEHQIKL